MAISFLPVSIIEAHVNLLVPHAATDSSAVRCLSKVATPLLVRHNAEPVLTAYYEIAKQTDPFDEDTKHAKRMLDAIRAHLAGES